MTSPSVLYAADERVDMQPIIDQMRSMLGQEKGKIYWDVLRRFMLARVSKQEFDNYIKKEVGIENVRLHNQFIKAVLLNAQCGRPPPEQKLPPVFPRTSKPFGCDRNSSAVQKRKQQREKEKQRQLQQEQKRAADRQRRAAEREAAAAVKAARLAQQQEYEMSAAALEMEGRADRKRKKTGGKGPLVGGLPVALEEPLLPRSRTRRGSEGELGERAAVAAMAVDSPTGGRSMRAKRERASSVGQESKKRELPADNVYIGFEDLPDAASMAQEVRNRASVSGLQVSDDSVDYIRHAMDIYINRILDTCKHGIQVSGVDAPKVLTMEDVRNATVDLQHNLPPWNLGKLREMCFVTCEMEPGAPPLWGAEEEEEEEEGV